MGRSMLSSTSMLAPQPDQTWSSIGFIPSFFRGVGALGGLFLWEVVFLFPYLQTTSIVSNPLCKLWGCCALRKRLPSWFLGEVLPFLLGIFPWLDVVEGGVVIFVVFVGYYALCKCWADQTCKTQCLVKSNTTMCWNKIVSIKKLYGKVLSLALMNENITSNTWSYITVSYKECWLYRPNRTLSSCKQY
jgi:hypothetical protein